MHFTNFYKVVYTLGSLLIPLIFDLPLCSTERVVSVADLHGDFERTVRILVAAELINPHTLAWSGGNATLVQTGDIVDRGDHGKQIYELFFRLADEAPEVGGTVINLMGNHEVLNIDRDFRYVTPTDYKQYGTAISRVKAWDPQGWLGRRVRQFHAVAKVDDVIFVHAGLLPQFLANGRGLDDINRDMWDAVNVKPHARNLVSAAIVGKDGPVWTRLFAESENDEACATVQEVLRLTNTKRVVVGHSIQESSDGYRVQTRCEGRIVLADTAISRAYGGESSFVERDRGGCMFAVYPDIGERHLLAMENGQCGL